MPKIKTTSEDGSKFIGLRLDKDTAAYYSKRAKEGGTTLSTFLRNMIVQGMIAENAQDIEMRMRELSVELNHRNGSGETGSLSETVLMSIFVTEQLLTKIVEARSIQELYDAQDRAKVKLNKEKGTKNG